VQVGLLMLLCDALRWSVVLCCGAI